MKKYIFLISLKYLYFEFYLKKNIQIDIMLTSIFSFDNKSLIISQLFFIIAACNDVLLKICMQFH